MYVHSLWKHIWCHQNDNSKRKYKFFKQIYCLTLMMIQDTWQFQTTFRNYYLKYCKPNYTVSRDCFSCCRFIKHVCGCLTIESTQTIVYISIALIVLYPRRILLRKHSSSGINSQFVSKFMPEICETAPDFTRFWITSIN